MIILDNYIQQFSQLRRAPGIFWSNKTRKRAPHKPILLMAVLDLVAQKLITSPVIDITGDLVELNEFFTGYWRCIMPIGQTSSIAFPFSRLHNEPFWELLPLQNIEITPAIINNITNVFQLRSSVIGAQIDSDLFLYMQQAASRKLLRNALLESCFSEEGQVALKEQTFINNKAYEYSEELVKKAHQLSIKDGQEFEPTIRDQGFRRIVVRTYDHRCALCGVRIITPEGRTAVDAAHIVPWSESKNDDIRNGMALCKLCHWSFDNGMLGVSGNYTVITSRQMVVHSNMPGFLTAISERGLILPQDQTCWPGQEYLAEHRSLWRI